MAIEKVMIIGNWELCLSIINALIPSERTQTQSDLHLSILTTPSQWLHLPPHVPANAVHHQKSDFSPASLKSAFAGQELVISTIGGGDWKQQMSIIDAVIAAGIQRFIPHEFGHDTLNKNISNRILQSAGRAKVIEYLRAASTNTSAFEWVGVATGYTLDTGLISGNLGVDLEWHSATIHGSGTEIFPASSLQRVGRVVTRVVAHWEQVKNQYIYAAGVLTSANDILGCAERVTKREFTVGYYDVEDCVKEAEARIHSGHPDSGMTLLERSILYDERLGATEPFELRNSNKLLQLPPESVNAIVVNAYHDLKRHGKSGCGCSS